MTKHINFFINTAYLIKIFFYMENERPKTAQKFVEKYQDSDKYEEFWKTLNNSKKPGERRWLYKMIEDAIQNTKTSKELDVKEVTLKKKEQELNKREEGLKDQERVKKEYLTLKEQLDKKSEQYSANELESLRIELEKTQLEEKQNQLKELLEENNKRKAKLDKLEDDIKKRNSDC